MRTNLHLGLKCKNLKLMQLQIILDIEGDSEWCLDEEAIMEANHEEDDIEHNQISLSLDTIEGVIGVSSIRLVGKVNRKEVGFLIDTEVIHNFVDPLTVMRLNLDAHEVKNFKIKLADGEKFVGSSCCKNIKMHIQGIETEVDLLITPLCHTHIILGTVLA